MSFNLTVLRTLGPLLAKSWKSDGTIADYDNARQFTVRRIPITDIHDLHKTLVQISADPRSAVIRGAPAQDYGSDVVLRRLGYFVDEPTPTLMIDLDGFRPVTCDPVTHPEAAIAEWIERHAPPFLQGISYVWQLSGSHGHPSKAGLLRAHLWFILAQPLACDQAEAWAAKYLPGTDCTVHRTVQLNYTAAPVMPRGQPDPITTRIGFVPGWLDDVLTIPDTHPVPDVSELRRVERSGRTELVDPRGKPGVVGAFCRAYSPYELCALAPEHFAEGSTPERITWLAGGGAREGVRITDSGTHIYNSHATAPLRRAANLFDFVRAHLFAHLDADLDPDTLEFMGATGAPSFAAMSAFALALPPVQAELNGPQAVAAREAQADTRAEKQLSEAEQRAARLERVLTRIAACPDMDTMEFKLARDIASVKTWTDPERAQMVGAMQTRSRTLMVGTRGMPLPLLRQWIAPRAAAEHTFPHLGDNGTPVATLENLSVLLARSNWTARYNVINKRQELVGEGLMGYSRDNRDVAVLAKLLSRCNELRLPVTMTPLRSLLAELCDSNPYNPVQEWIDSRPWDGVARLQALADTLASPPGTDEALKLTILRKWLLQCIAAAYSETPPQLRGVIALVGPQGIGKSRWIMRLVADHPEFAVAGRTLDPHNKDHVMLSVRSWITELGELEGTFRKADNAALKAFLSQDTDTLRLPYAAAESTFTRRTCFAATVNYREFLTDDSGSTRFWPIEAIAINADHDIDMQQLFAEMLVAWRSGESHFFALPELAEVQHQNEEHEVEDPVRDRIAARFAWDEARECRCRPGERDSQWSAKCPGHDHHDTHDTEFAWERHSATHIAVMAGMRGETKAELASVVNWLRKFGAVRCRRVYAGRGWWVPVPVKSFGAME